MDDTLKGPYAINPGEVFMIVDRNYINKTGYTRLDSVESGLTWILPLPDNIEYSASWDWEESNIKVMSDAIANASWETVWNQGLALITDKIETIPYGLGNNVAGQLHRQLTEHRTANLNPRLFFSGQPKQDFSLSFTVVPWSSEVESNLVSGIQELYVQATPESDIASGESFWNLPSLFKSTVFSPGNEDGNKPPIITRPNFVIRGIQIAALDTTTHETGLPTSFKLIINCLEFDFITKDDRAKLFRG